MKTRDIVENAIVIPTTINPKSHHEPDHEVEMAKSDLYRAGKSAMELHKMLKSVSEEKGLEGWVQAKITKAADYLESVYHYLDYQMRGEHELDEQLPGSTTTAPAAAPGVAAPAGTVVQANPQMAAAAAAKAAQQRKKALQDAIRQKQKELSDLQKQLSAPVTVSENKIVKEEFKNTYNVGDKVSGSVGSGTIVSVSKKVNIDGLVKVKLQNGEIVTVKTTDLKHIDETASAGASAAGGIATALGGNGFVNGGPGTLKRAKKTTKEGRMAGLQMDPRVVEAHKAKGFKGPFELKALPKAWYESLKDVYGAQDNSHVMISGNNPNRDDWIMRVENITGRGIYAFGSEDGYGIGNLSRAISSLAEVALLGKPYKKSKAEHRPDTAMGSDPAPKAKGAGKFGQQHPLKGKLVGGD